MSLAHDTQNFEHSVYYSLLCKREGKIVAVVVIVIVVVVEVVVS